MAECNDHQGHDLARQITSRWAVEAVPWNLSNGREPPTGIIIGTWFHFVEMRFSQAFEAKSTEKAEALTVSSGTCISKSAF